MGTWIQICATWILFYSYISFMITAHSPFACFQAEMHTLKSVSIRFGYVVVLKKFQWVKIETRDQFSKFDSISKYKTDAKGSCGLFVRL